MTTQEIQCPYCDNCIEIVYPTTDSGIKPVEDVLALPYARDVKVFDPKEPGTIHSGWTRIGKDFFGVLNYERFGILHMERGWDVRYCVARCTKCKNKMDVFANFTKGQSLSQMSPHLLAKANGAIKPRNSGNIFSQLFDNRMFRLLFSS